MFLVGVFEEKARLLQWLVFFSSVQRDRSTFFVHLFNFLTERLTRIFWGLRSRRAWVRIFYASKSRGETKGSPLCGFLFGTMRHFSEKFWILSEGIPLNFLKFSVCKKRLISLKGLFLGFSAICDFFYQIRFEKKSKFFQLLFLEYFWVLDMKPTWAVPGLFFCWIRGRNFILEHKIRPRPNWKRKYRSATIQWIPEWQEKY